MLFRVLLICLFVCPAVGAQSIDEYRRQASTLVRSYQWNEAIQILQKGLRSYPDDPGLLAQLGGLLVRAGQVSQAQVFLSRASTLDPANAEIVRDLGEVKLRLGQLPAAIQLFRKSLGLRAGGESCYRLAFAFFLNGELKEALN